MISLAQAWPCFNIRLGSLPITSHQSTKFTLLFVIDLTLLFKMDDWAFQKMLTFFSWQQQNANSQVSVQNWQIKLLAISYHSIWSSKSLDLWEQLFAIKTLSRNWINFSSCKYLNILDRYHMDHNISFYTYLVRNKTYLFPCFIISEFCLIDVKTSSGEVPLIWRELKPQICPSIVCCLTCLLFRTLVTRKLRKYNFHVYFWDSDKCKQWSMFCSKHGQRILEF